jgi:hypothetical protein
MPSPTKEGERDIYGIERGKNSCERVSLMLENRPWVNGEVITTAQYSIEDYAGIDIFALVDQRLVDLLCMEQEERGLKFQVKSERGKENGFHHKHKEEILNLATGENIFVLNGQEDFSMMTASFVGQIVAMAELSGTVSESVVLSFLADDLHDEEAVMAYITHRDTLIKRKWFKWWLDGSKIKAWNELMPELLIVEA